MHKIAELVVTTPAAQKLGARRITAAEVHQVTGNPYRLVRNPTARAPGHRPLLIAQTDGGRVLTLVVERTSDPTTWVVITGWDATRRQRKMLWRRR